MVVILEDMLGIPSTVTEASPNLRHIFNEGLLKATAYVKVLAL
jgi:hypothetical protein